jgi:hypothetical protein
MADLPFERNKVIDLKRKIDREASFARDILYPAGDSK